MRDTLSGIIYFILFSVLSLPYSLDQSLSTLNIIVSETKNENRNVKTSRANHPLIVWERAIKILIVIAFRFYWLRSGNPHREKKPQEKDDSTLPLSRWCSPQMMLIPITGVRWCDTDDSYYGSILLATSSLSHMLYTTRVAASYHIIILYTATGIHHIIVN